jgi:hypothetical protein
MYLAPNQIIGCAGLHLDTDQPARGENALTGYAGTGAARASRRI